MTDELKSRTSNAESGGMAWWTQQWSFTWKELCETLRDRRTTVTLIAMPVLLYPLVGLMFRFVAVGEALKRAPEYRIAVETEQEAAWLSSVIQSGNHLLEAQSEPLNTKSLNTKSLITNSDPKIQFLIPETDTAFSLSETLAVGGADLGIRVVFSERQISNDFPGADLELFQIADDVLSREVAGWLRQRLVATNLLTAANTIRQSGDEYILPVQERTQWVKLRDQTSAIVGLLPLVLLLMTVTGGVYPAIDLTAGERERDTLETLMALPVSRTRLLMAKYVAVLTVTLLTGLMNIFAMSVTVYALQMEKTLFGETGLTLLLIVRLFSMLFLFSLFYSAILLLVTSSARSFKEAQALLIPVMLMTIAPGLVIMMPGWRLEGWPIVLPIINMLLMAKELLEGTLTLLPAMVATASTLLFAAAALSVAAGLFGMDSVLTGSRSGWRDVFQRSSSATETPSSVVGLTTLAFLFPMHFLASGFLSRFTGSQFSLRLILSAAMTVLLFAGVPFLVMRWRRIPLRSGASLTRPAIRLWPGVVLLGLSTWPWIYEMIMVMQSVGLQSLDESKRQIVAELLQSWRQVPVALVLVSLGILPGLCEEFFFRGFLLSGLRRDMNAAAAIVISAVCFGFFHVILAGGAAPERLFPSTIMGLLLGWVTYRGNSVVPAMVLHAIHNSTLLSIAHFNQDVSQWVVGSSQQVHLPAAWLVVSGFTLAIGLIWVGFSRTSGVRTKSLVRQENSNE